jgi:hypothetical protein
MITAATVVTILGYLKAAPDIAGAIESLAAFFKLNPAPTQEQIDAVLSGYKFAGDERTSEVSRFDASLNNS